MNKNMGLHIMAVVGALVVGQHAWAQTETVTVKRDAPLRESPAESAPTLASLPAQTPVTRMQGRRGPWIEVRTAQGQTGWVHLFDVGTAPAAQSGNFATGALRGLTGLFGGGNSLAPTTRTATATIGIRGLGAEEITNAQPNLNAVVMMEALRVDAGQAQQFGSVAGLAAQPVEPLPAPPPPAGSTAPGATGSVTGGDNR